MKNTAADSRNLGADAIRWDLGVFYSGVHDPQIALDTDTLAELAKKFNGDYKGSLSTKLGSAINDYAAIKMLTDKVIVYLYLLQSLDVTDAATKTKMSEAEQKISFAYGEYLTFFDIELVALDDAVLQKLYDADANVLKYRSWIEHLRVFKPHLLSEPVEAALTKRSPFGTGAWSEFFDECEADLSFDLKGQKRTLVEMLDLLTNSQDPAERASAMQTINNGLGGYFGKYAAQTLYMVAGEDAVERKDRAYPHPMSAQNKANHIQDAVVEALHNAVTKIAGPLATRYYRLKAGLLGMKTLAWSDRNAPLPFADPTLVPFDDAMATVLAAYQSFSPTLAEIVRDFGAAKRIDAPATKGKRGGAYNYSIMLPGDRPASFTFLNYLGSDRDVMTLAHELGHGVHGILAARAQGPLMFHAPIAYCETASVFGEMTTFNFLKRQLAEKGETAALLSLVTGKIEDAINTIVRQIGFSNFERRLHGMDATYRTWEEPKKRSAEELDVLWLQTLKELYGEDGDVFTYKDTEHLWSYISHFHRPFYVYGYAFGELLTQSLYAKQATLGARFEPLYLDLLRSGGTKDAVQLLQPFGLDPSQETFWADGIRVGLGAMIEEAEQLARAQKKAP